MGRHKKIAGSQLWVLVTLGLVLGAGAFVATRSEHRAIRTNLYSQSREALTTARFVIESQTLDVSRNVLRMAHNQEFRELIDTGAPDARRHVVANWRRALEVFPMYDQLRWIDASGQERIRENQAQGHPLDVPVSELQNKAGRPYFVQTSRLKAGEVYISPLDLNIEHGQIERPLKPTIRVATPVFDSAGAPAGIVIVNFLANEILQALDRRAAAGLWLVNADGYWLRGPDVGSEWGHLLGRPEDSLAQRYPDAWNKLMAAESGEFESAEGLWAFDTEDTAGYLGAHGIVQDTSGHRTGAAAPLKLIKFLPRAEYRAQYTAVSLRMAAFALLSFAVVAWIVRQRVRSVHRQAEKLQQFINAQPVALAVFNRELRLTNFNARYAEWFELPFALLEGRPHAEEIVEHMRHQQENCSSNDELIFRRQTEMLQGRRARSGICRLRNGRDVEMTRTTLPGGRNLITAVDVTLQRSLQHEVEEHEQMLEQMSDTALIGAFDMNVETQKIRYSRLVARMHGIPENTLISLDEAIALYPTAIQKGLREAVERVLQGGAPLDEVFPYRAEGDRATRWFHIVASLKSVTSETGEITRRFTGAVQDITALKSAQLLLANQRDLLDAVIQNSPDGVGVFDEQRRLILFNEKFADYLQFSRELLAQADVTMEDLCRERYRSGAYPEMSEAALIERFAGLIDHRMPEHFERAGPDGRIIEVDVTPLPGQRTLFSLADITEIRMSERWMADVLAELETVNAIARMGRWELNLETRRSKLSATAREIVEMGDETSSSDFPALMAEIFQGASFGEMRKVMDRAIAEHESWDIELDIVTLKGNRRWIRSIGKPTVVDGRCVQLVGTLQDLTERHRLQVELELMNSQLTATLADLDRKSNYLSQILGAIMQGVVIVGTDRRVKFHNPQVAELLRLPPPLVESEPTIDEVLEFERKRGDFADGSEANTLVGILDQGELRAPERHVRHTPWGTDLEVMTIPMASGEVLRTYTDVSPYLEAKRKADEASRAKSAFLANMSHEIRTPLNAVLGLLRLLQDSELQPSQRDYARKSEQAARSLLEILNDILDYSKIEAGKMELHLVPFEFEEMLREMSVLMSASLGDKRLDLLFDIDPAMPRWVVGDGLRLRQVLINLCGNAIKFTAQGEVRLTLKVLRRENRRLHLRIAIIDTGIGIAPEAQARIFEGFSQAESSTSRRFGGTGLGLAISQRLLGLMGTRLELESEPGRGSTFSFQIVMDEADETSVQAQVERPPMQGLRVLVVNDQPNSRDLLARMCRSWGWSSEVTGDEQQAARIVERAYGDRSPFDMVFVESLYDDARALHTVRELDVVRLHASSARPLALFVITNSSRRFLQVCTPEDRLRIDGYLVKPLTASMVYDLVAEHRMGGRPAEQLRRPPHAPRLKGLCLLLAEDNLVNQEVAGEMLRREGAKVLIAANGKEAVDRVLADDGRIDLVLMDMQMPEMDGLEATRILRRDPRKRDLPIVAMTANAMASDRADCLNAGMNDHVAKPFDLDHLVARIRHWVGREADDAGTARADAAHPDATRVAVAAEGIEAPVLNVEAGLGRVGGDVKFYANVLRRLQEDAPRLRARLEAALEAKDTGEIAAASHALKGLSATVGAERLAALSANAENLARSAGAGPPEAPLVALTQSLFVGIKDVFTAIAQWQHAAGIRTAAPSPGGGGRQAAVRALEKLEHLLQDADAGAFDQFDELRTRHGATLGTGIQALEAAVAALDFEGAAKAARALRQSLDKA